jgi:hypothetical protein
VLKSERCCGESGTLGVTRPDISTQVRFRKEEELRKRRGRRCAPPVPWRPPEREDPDLLPELPAGAEPLRDDLNNGLLEADYIVVEMANQILGPDWLPEYVATRQRTAASSACWLEALRDQTEALMVRKLQALAA